MAQFLIQLKYQRGTSEKWSNVWRVEAADLITASGAASAVLAPALADLLDPSCQIVEALTRTPGTPGAFITQALALTGTLSGVGSLLPLFNCMKVVFPLLTGGRPDLKYLKGIVGEADSDAGLLSSGIISSATTALENMISSMATAGAQLVDNSGENYSVVTIQQAIQMRQMHRKRKKSV
jgi:hypothetical protein